VAEKGWQRKFDDRSRRRTARNSVHCARRSPTLAETVPEAERDMPAVTTAAERPRPRSVALPGYGSAIPLKTPSKTSIYHPYRCYMDGKYGL
jgi:hypothetical protein